MVSSILNNHKIFEIISEVSSQMDLKTYVIGGFVRDNILGRKPSKDIDIVTVGNSIELTENIAKELPRYIKIQKFKNFRTAMIRYREYEIEFVGARKESYDFNSRKPTVDEGTLQDDQKRRDFTINVLALSLNKENYGELIDPFGGIQDLKDKIIRTPLDPDTTYSDDPLRMMRAVRFAVQLGFEIEQKSLVAIKKNHERLSIISKERIMGEFNKIMLTTKPSLGLNILFHTGLLEDILPELTALKGVEEVDKQTHKDNFFHTLQVVDNICENTDNLWLRWAALLHDIGKKETKRFDKKMGWTFHNHEYYGAKVMVPKIFHRLHLPVQKKMRYVQKMVMLSSRPIVLAQDIATDSALRRLLFDAGDDIDDLMTLCEADITTKNLNRFRKYKNNFKIVRQKLKEIEQKDKIKNWKSPISGELIMNTFHLTPCREIGMIKEAIKEAILEGKISNEYNSAFKLMLEKGKELNLQQKNKQKYDI